MTVDTTLVETELKEDVLPLFRTRAELFRWAAVRAYAQDAQDGVAALREAAREIGADPVIPYVQKAIDSTVRVIGRADDSSGAIGDVVRDLLNLHAQFCAAAAPVPAAKLDAWLIKFQFNGVQDFFEPDIVRYVDALGPTGLDRYRRELATIAEGLPPEPSEEEKRPAFALRNYDRYESLSRHSHTRFLLELNAQRLAVTAHDVDTIIELYGGDQTRSYRLHEVAKALTEIGEVDRAIDFAQQATLLEEDHQAEHAALYWCEVLAAHRPAEVLAARQVVFDRWPASSNATRLHQSAGKAWPDLQHHVLARLSARPYDYVSFLLHTLKDVRSAWSEAHRLELDSDDVWTRLVNAYSDVDPAAVVPVLHRLIESDLRVADVRSYRSAARRLTLLRTISARTGILTGHL